MYYVAHARLLLCQTALVPPLRPPLPPKRYDRSATRMAATARGQVSVSLIEASDHIMGAFDEKLVAYTTRLLENRKVGTS